MRNKSKEYMGNLYKTKLTKRDLKKLEPITEIELLDLKGNLIMKFRRESNEKT